VLVREAWGSVLKSLSWGGSGSVHARGGNGATSRTKKKDTGVEKLGEKDSQASKRRMSRR